MAEPILIVHGVANHTPEPFLRNVEELQSKLGADWRLIPVFWGDLGGASVDISDCLPIQTAAGWTVRSEDELLSATLTRADVGGGKLSNEERANLIARQASGSGEDLVRAEEPDGRVTEAVRGALPDTKVLKFIDDPAILREVGAIIRAATEGMTGGPSTAGGGEEFSVRGDESDSEDVRGWLDPISDAARRVVHSVDDMLGKFLGDRLGQFNQKLRSAVAGPFALFFGDILVYQRNQEAIQQRIWDAIEKDAPGYGTEQKPIHAIAHSLGGVVVFDSAVRTDSKGRRLWLKSFTTFGSQPAFFHIIDPRQQLQHYLTGDPVELPETIGRWTNLWDTLDVLAFTAGTVFRLHDGTTPTDIPVEDPLSLLVEEKGWAHSIYWKTEELRQALEKTLVAG